MAVQISLLTEMLHELDGQRVRIASDGGINPILLSDIDRYGFWVADAVPVAGAGDAGSMRRAQHDRRRSLPAAPYGCGLHLRGGSGAGWLAIAGAHGWLCGSLSEARAMARWLSHNLGLPVRHLS